MSQVATLPSTFDLTFDYTFQGLIPGAADVAADECRIPAIHLAWLSVRGWVYYPFQGNSDEDVSVKSAGQLERAGLLVDTYKISTPVITARAGGLTKDDAAIVCGIFKSAHVYALGPTPDGKIQAAPVRIDEGSFPVWRDASNRINVEVKITFPNTKSQRA